METCLKDLNTWEGWYKITVCGANKPTQDAMLDRNISNVITTLNMIEVYENP